MSYENLVKPSQNKDLGVAIQNLIEDNIKLIGTSYLAKITKINGNKVSIMPIIKRNATDKDIIYNNCLVAFPHSQNWNIQHKLKVGDYGIAVIMDKDITYYKQNGKQGLAKTKRFKDRNDSIFIPLSLFDTLENENINFLIKSDDGVCELSFDNNQNGLLKARLLTLESENTTLKTKLSELATILENALITQAPSGTMPFDSNTITNFQSWKTSLDELFEF